MADCRRCRLCREHFIPDRPVKYIFIRKIGDISVIVKKGEENEKDEKCLNLYAVICAGSFCLMPLAHNCFFFIQIPRIYEVKLNVQNEGRQETRIIA